MKNYRKNRNENGLRNYFQMRNIIDLRSDRWFQNDTIINKICTDDRWTFEIGYGLDEDGNYPEGF